MEFEKNQLTAISKLGEKIFFNPSPTYSYKEIITGCRVISGKKIMCAVAENTFLKPAVFGLFSSIGPFNRELGGYPLERWIRCA